jgi:DNA modification methylase
LYVEHLVAVFREVRRVLRSDGTFWLNIGDCYATGAGSHTAENSGKHGYRMMGPMTQPNRMPLPGLKPKDLCLIPFRVALALQSDGWYVRQDIIWSKPNPMPESVTDRPTTVHEHIFLLAKSERYFYDAYAVRERTTGNAHDRGGGLHLKSKTAGANSRIHLDQDVEHAGRAVKQNRSFSAAVTKVVSSRNLRSVWEIATAPYSEAHFATFPPKLVEPCIKAGTSEYGCCAKCGAPWERVLEKRTVNCSNAAKAGHKSNGKGHVSDQVREDHDVRDGPTTEITHTGWKPGCDCGTGRQPCTVLDPFSGAGTTALVASRLGRSPVGIEANPEYNQMAQRRIREDAPMFNEVRTA